MKFSSAILVALPIVLTSWTAAAVPQNRKGASSVEARNIDAINGARVVARALQRHAAELAVFERDFDETLLTAWRKCTSSRDCLGMICIRGTCQ
ncbi:hypothetical protein DXG03_007486 [Asterophora parasitica]|uniref:Uncharacterized protein n=1 Tax=Asterophora parasitica TaxID=117018 RepID=A0A9P7G0P0_9AGAR|nr:hypothetical protein DXG03_007486 [Asterophora parasitica]